MRHPRHPRRPHHARVKLLISLSQLAEGWPREGRSPLHQVRRSPPALTPSIICGTACACPCGPASSHDCRPSCPSFSLCPSSSPFLSRGSSPVPQTSHFCEVERYEEASPFVHHLHTPASCGLLAEVGTHESVCRKGELHQVASMIRSSVLASHLP